MKGNERVSFRILLTCSFDGSPGGWYSRNVPIDSGGEIMRYTITTQATDGFYYRN